jgi:DSBA-like thioredoxin domain
MRQLLCIYLIGLASMKLLGFLLTGAMSELIDATNEAIERGVFGVPTFVFRDEHFWGQDRMDQLAATIAGKLSLESQAVEALLALPRAAERRRSDS